VDSEHIPVGERPDRVDADPWHVLAKEPREFTALLAWMRALEGSGSHVTLLGSPDLQQEQYMRRLGLDRGELTVDAHVEILGTQWYVDHTTICAPRSKSLPTATAEAEAELTSMLRGAVLESRLGGLVVTVVPQLDEPKLRRRVAYYRALADLCLAALATGAPVYDRAADANFPIAVPQSPADPERPIVFSFAHPVSGGTHRATRTGWVHNFDAFTEDVARPIIEKLTDSKRTGRGGPGQLRRAAQLPEDLRLPVGLLIDARVAWSAPSLALGPQGPAAGAPVIDLGPEPVAAMLATLGDQYPGVLDRAWLLETSGRVSVVYDVGREGIPFSTLPAVPPAR
jgi:hypothetical protein